MVDPGAILAVISDLRTANGVLEQRVAELEHALSEVRDG